MRVSPPRIFGDPTHASRPPAEAAGSADAFRQARFVVGDELDIILEILEAEAAVAQDASGSKYRTQVVAATLTAWSASWLVRLQSLHAVEWGNYIAALILVRSACEAQATAAGHLAGRAAAWDEWLAADGIAQDPARHAMSFWLNSAAVTDPAAPDDDVAELHAALSAVLESPFGGATLLTAADSSPDRIAPTFGDRDFHLGLAELALGGLLLLGAVQLETLVAREDSLPISDKDRLSRIAGRARQLTARADRCRIEAVAEGDATRYLVHNFRRAPSAVPRRYIL